MNKVFKDLAAYVRVHDGFNKPRINFQEMYQLFPEFEFTATTTFGQYFHFGEAFEHKDLSMMVSFEGHVCHMTYREYYDTVENTAYIS